MNIEETHKENKKLILEYGLKVGKKYILKESVYSFAIGSVFTISHIHSLYGWVLFKETEQLPQEVSKLIKLFKLKKEVKGGNKK